MGAAEIAAVAALGALCAVWAVLQLWITRRDPGNPGVVRECDGGCGSCTGGERDGRCSRSASRFHFEGFNAPESRPIGDQCAKVFLPADHPRHHVANKKPIHLISLRIPHRIHNCLGCKLPERLVPMFFHGCLADAKNGDFTHGNSFP